MESVRAKLDTYLRTAVIVLLVITKMKKMGSANVRFKSESREGRTLYIIIWRRDFQRFILSWPRILIMLV